jgi:hypothetical protein
VKAPEIAEEAIRKVNRRITNLVFLEIQNDRQLMQHYLRCVETDGLDKTNQQIGKAVKASYELKNLPEREDDPTCTLIQSHQIFS